ncbi:MAG: phosphoenolpyruvate carboxylase [Candidatus Micrarchaeota archaeon]|nr:phosphoenolpyruvate carboxylase [Candidatus Micrarchaeota archaeon]
MRFDVILMKVSRIMSTQHPDNVTVPFFAENSVMTGDDEIKEAFYAFSHLGIDEQLWDAEGKEVDNFVVKKLLTRYTDYFLERILGKDKFITIRVPNPDIEKDEGKILLEALHSIPRNFDIGEAFYQRDIAPISEAVVPMCSSEKPLIRIHEYYKKFIIGSQKQPLYKGDITLSRWVGRLKPDNIRVTPLFETKDAILNADKYVEKYIRFEKIDDFQRVWFARSDPAINYGSVSAVIINKIGLLRLHELERRSSVDILPIIGCGSAPFRGNFSPENAEYMLRGYPSIHTFTTQSAFKYDHPVTDVIKAIERIKSAKRKEPVFVDVKGAMKVMDKIENEYRKCVKVLAPTINLMAKYIPSRRKRKLHISLFGYARKTDDGIKLPRAITFCASLYSLGIPPEMLGLSTLTEKDIDNIREFYPNIDGDMNDALKYFNKDNLKFLPQSFRKRAEKTAELFDFTIDERHNELTTTVMKAFRKHDMLSLQENIVKAANIRRFLG